MTIKEKIEALRRELREHNHKYYVLASPTISDYEFDMKLKELQALEEQYPEFMDATSPTIPNAIFKWIFRQPTFWNADIF